MTDKTDTARWQKMLALLDSPQENEAIAALAALRAQLAQQGLRLADIMAPAAPAPQAALLAERQREVDRLRGQLAAALKMADDWRQTAQLSQRAQARDSQAAEKWRRLAQATADSLWELGQQLRSLDEQPGTVLAFRRPQDSAAG